MKWESSFFHFSIALSSWREKNSIFWTLIVLYNCIQQRFHEQTADSNCSQKSIASSTSTYCSNYSWKFTAVLNFCLFRFRITKKSTATKRNRSVLCKLRHVKIFTRFSNQNKNRLENEQKKNGKVYNCHCIRVPYLFEFFNVLKKVGGKCILVTFSHCF